MVCLWLRLDLSIMHHGLQLGKEILSLGSMRPRSQVHCLCFDRYSSNSV